MGRNTKWTEELKNEMVKFFEDAEKVGNKSVRENSEAFAKKHDNLTASQVKTAYYKFYETAQKANTNAPASSRWSEKENNELLNAIQNRKGTLADVFEKHAQKYNRTHNNVSQHYYFLLRQSENNKNTKKTQTFAESKNTNKANQTNKWTKKTKNEEIEKLAKSMKRLPIETIESLNHIISSINKKA